MLHKNYYLLMIVACVVLSCRKPIPVLDGFNQQVWKDDKNGCSSKRLVMLDAITSERKKLLALEEMEIVELLGKPDQNELYNRNQKCYHYYIQSAPACGDSTIHNPKRLSIRFNAMGLAKEVSVE